MPPPKNLTKDQANLGWHKFNRVFGYEDVINMARGVIKVDGKEYNDANKIIFMKEARGHAPGETDKFLLEQWGQIYTTPYGFLGIGTYEEKKGVKYFKKSIYADFLNSFPNKAYYYFRILYSNYQLPHPFMQSAVKNRYIKENKKTKPFILVLKTLVNLFDIAGNDHTFLTKGEILNYLQFQFFDLTDDEALSAVVNQILHNRTISPNPNEAKPDNEEPYHRFVKQMSYTKLFDFTPERIIANQKQIKRAQKLIKHCKFSYIDPDQGNWSLDYFKIMTPENYTLYKVRTVPKVDIKQISKLKFYCDDDSIIQSLITSLSIGKSVILYGPPGTGKTLLATQIAEFFGCTSDRITASDDWSTYDTLGGLVHKGTEGFKGKDGAIVNSIEKCYKSMENGKNGNWLIIDEINRCKIDAALGEMFTCLETMHFSGLSEKEIENKWESYFTLNLNFRDIEELRKLPIPRTFRIIGTLNTYDKHFLHNISYALTRRFSYVYVPVLKNWDTERELITKSVIGSIKDSLNIELSNLNEFENLFLTLKNFSWFLRGYSGIDPKVPNIEKEKIIREIGTAQLIDTMKMCISEIFLFEIKDPKNQLKALDNAICANIIPQLQGLGPKLDSDLIDKIKDFGLILSVEKLDKMKKDDELF